MQVLSEDDIAIWFDYRFSQADGVGPVYGDPGPIFARALNGLPATASQAVDVACGDGRYAIPAAQEGLHVTAYDFLPVALERVRKRAQATGCESRVSAVLKRVSELPELEGSQDLVVCGSCNLHLWGREKAVDALGWFKRAIGDRGTLFLCLSTNIKRILPTGEEFKYETEARFTKEEARKLLEAEFSDWPHAETHIRTLDEEWDIPHKLRSRLGDDHYNRTEDEITLLAER
jgi:SAM-dependent methyltransferase